MIMPSHAKNVKLYNDPVPLFARYQVEGYLGGDVQSGRAAESGGYIVIGIDRSAVAIDVNCGRSTTAGAIEETAFQAPTGGGGENRAPAAPARLCRAIVIDSSTWTSATRTPWNTVSRTGCI